MKKFYLTTFCLTIMAFPAFAQGTLIIDDGQNSIITGVVKDIRFDNLIIEVNGKDLEVDIDALDIDDNVDNYFPIGTAVRVVGELEDEDEFNATKVMKINAENSTDIIITDD